MAGQDWQALAPRAVENEPEAQKAHVGGEVAPRAVEKVPGPQRVQFWMRPRDEEKEPAGHATQADAPREVEKVPAEHSAQLAEVVTPVVDWKVPAPHLVQLAKERMPAPVWNVPVRQTVQALVETCVAYVPGRHKLQLALLCALLNDPDGQAVHPIMSPKPSVVEKVPASQG